jgi:hypothetical protein
LFATTQLNVKHKISKALVMYIVAAMLAGMALLAYPSRPASAAGTIWNCNDFATFKQAVEAGGVVTIMCTDEINILQTMEITNDTTIIGGGPYWAALNAHHSVRLFNVHSGKTFTLKNISLREGSSSTEGGIIFAANATINIESAVLRDSVNGYASKGGAISMYGGKLTMNNSYLWNNSSWFGGAIYNKAGTVEITNGNAIGNQAVTDGGLLYNDGGSFKITGGSYTQNKAGRFGGVILIPEGGENWQTSITNATFSNNQAYVGGVLHVLSSSYSGAVMVKGSTFDHNTASYGGAFANEVKWVLIEVANSTFANNNATVAGGAAVVWKGALQLDNVTVAGNTSPKGSNLFTDVNGTVSMRNSIVANGTGSSNCAGNVPLASNSLQFPGSSCGAGIPVADPRLTALGNYGGTTQTMLLIAGSPAINAGNNQVCALPTIANKDQRGMSRQAWGANCDLGATEFQGPKITPRK